MKYILFHEIVQKGNMTMEQILFATPILLLGRAGDC